MTESKEFLSTRISKLESWFEQLETAFIKEKGKTDENTKMIGGLKDLITKSGDRSKNRGATFG